MANETKLERWLNLQRVTWSCDEGGKATHLALQDRNGDQIAEFAMSTPNLATVIGDVLDMQADELPQGAHQFRLVSFDDAKHQLSEINQTIRGRNKDATAAAQELVSLQNATAKALSNASEVQRQQGQLNQQLVEFLDAERDNTNALMDGMRTLRDCNFESELRLREFDKRQERLDQVLECVTTIVGLLAPPLMRKFLPGIEIPGLPSAAAPQVPASPPTQEPMKAPENGSTEKPADAPIPSVDESRQATHQDGSKGGRSGDGRIVPAKSRRTPLSSRTTAIKRGET